VDHTRHSALFDVSRKSAILIGAGGIGAATALALSKMGIGSIDLYDGDTVDEINLATQLHRLSDVGKPKVRAVAEMIEEFSDDTAIAAVDIRIEKDDEFISDFLISAVDSIHARKDIWEAAKKSHIRYYFDARMAAEEFHLYAVNMSEDVNWYETMISQEDDTNVLEIACTAKATIFCAFIAAGLIGSAVKTVSIEEHQPRVTVLNIRNLALTVIP
jgi:molybdopterin/thiamine biosynthesis adenylyltransferase